MAFVAIPGLACGTEDAVSSEQEEFAVEAHMRWLKSVESPKQEGAEVVFSSFVALHDGDVVRAEQLGELSEDVRRHVANPTWYSDEEFYYEEDATREGAGGSDLSASVYTVTRYPNKDIEEPPLTEDGPPEVTDELKDALAQEGASDSELLELEITPRGIPRFAIASLPEAGAVPSSEMAMLAQERDDRVAARRKQVETVAEPTVSRLKAEDARVDYVSWSTGAIFASVPRRAMPTLLERKDILQIGLVDLETTEDSDHVSIENNAPLSRAASDWTLGAAQGKAYADSIRFADHGYDGTNGSSSELIGAVIEGTELSTDYPCYLLKDGTPGANTCQWSDPESRMVGQIRCNGSNSSFCVITSSPGTSDQGSHAVVVASAMLADWDDCQGWGRAHNDPAYTPSLPCHDSPWRESASAPARGARVIMVNRDGTGSKAAAKALDYMIASSTYHPDVVNQSAHFSQSCKPMVAGSGEGVWENAFDAGMFVLATPGNSRSSTCKVGNPGDTPKVFVVNGTWNCITASSYSSCGISAGEPGGATVDVGSSKNWSGEMSLIDLVAPTRIYALTNSSNSDGEYGNVKATQTPGTSIASPFTAGVALAIKDHFIAQGKTWISNPGRLHTIMLAMGDMYGSTDWSASSAIHMSSGGMVSRTKRWGFGHLKARFFHGSAMPSGTAWQYRLKARTFSTSSSAYTFLAGVGPAHSQADIVKCVMLQHEDVDRPSGDKDWINNFRVTLYKSNDTRTSCTSTPSGSYSTAVFDASFDTKKAVVDRGDVAGRCFWLKLDPVVVDESITTTSFCYHLPYEDDEGML